MRGERGRNREEGKRERGREREGGEKGKEREIKKARETE